MENLDPPPPPQIKDGKMARFLPFARFHGFILDLGGDGGLLFHFLFVQDSSKLRLQASLPWNLCQSNLVQSVSNKRRNFWSTNEGLSCQSAN